MSDETSPRRTYTADVGLRWGDMDAYGHVNNAQYHRLLEEARIIAFSDWFHSRDGESMLSSGVLLARQEVEFLDQLVHRTAPVAIEMWVTHLGAASWDMGYEMRDPEGYGNGLYARAESTLVAFDRDSQRPRRLGEQERSVLEAHLGDPVPMRRRR